MRFSVKEKAHGRISEGLLHGSDRTKPASRPGVRCPVMVWLHHC